jgi:hypothetical protein
MFNQKHVDYPLRHFVKMISNSKAMTKWRTQPILIKQIPSNTPINWPYTEFCLKFSHYSMFAENNTHFYHGSLFSFKLEILHNTLPTIKNLIRNYPTLLPPNLNCLYCNQTPEDISHLFSCQANSNLDSIPWLTIQQLMGGVYFVENYFVDNHFVDNHFVDGSFRRQFISSKVHFVESSFRRQFISSKIISSTIISSKIISSTIISSTIISSKIISSTIISSTVHFVDSSFRRQLFRRQLFRRQSLRRQSFRRQPFRRQFISSTFYINLHHVS